MELARARATGQKARLTGLQATQLTVADLTRTLREQGDRRELRAFLEFLAAYAARGLDELAIAERRTRRLRLVQ